jgi:hypothetical protein
MIIYKMCDNINDNINDNIPIYKIEENTELEVQEEIQEEIEKVEEVEKVEKVQEVEKIQEVEQNKFVKYANLVEQINQHIQSYYKFVNSKYFKEIYSTYKTQEDLELLKDFSKTIFQITNDYDLENFMKYAQQAEKIMENTDGMIGFCKSFSDCFIYHIQEIIMKINNNNK